MEPRSTIWYVQRRGELLAEQFLLDLQPDDIIANSSAAYPFDFIACFTKPNGSTVLIGVEVKTTQQKIDDRYPFPAEQATKLINSNIPILVVVVNVKANEVYFNWIEHAVSAEKQAELSTMRTCNLALRKSSAEEIQRLKSEILTYRILATSR